MAKTKFEEVLLAALGIVIFWLLIDRESDKKEIKNLRNELAENENLTEEIKKQLRDLIDNNKEIDSGVANELAQIAALIEIKQDTTAVFKLAKIIENLLKELYQDDPKIKELAKSNHRRNPTFADYLEHAKNTQLISSEEFHLVSIIKIIRNEEAHELDLKKEKSRLLVSVISGIGIILSLCRRLKKNSLSA